MANTDATAVDLKLEVVTIPVSDVERAKQFYARLGWRLDADIAVGQFRVVQFTPPHSDASIHFGTNLTAAVPGSADRLLLAVSNIEAARADLVDRGADVSEIYHYERDDQHSGELDSRVPGPDPHGRSYVNYATFQDPDGNGWFLQEIESRLPGRTWADAQSQDVQALADLLHETSELHGNFEAVAPPHNWWDWYAAYLHARQHASSSDDAVAIADKYMADVKHIAP